METRFIGQVVHRDDADPLNPQTRPCLPAITFSVGPQGQRLVRDLDTRGGGWGPRALHHDPMATSKGRGWHHLDECPYDEMVQAHRRPTANPAAEVSTTGWIEGNEVGALMEIAVAQDHGIDRDGGWPAGPEGRAAAREFSTGEIDTLAAHLAMLGGFSSPWATQSAETQSLYRAKARQALAVVFYGHRETDRPNTTVDFRYRLTQPESPSSAPSSTPPEPAPDDDPQDGHGPVTGP